MNIRLILLLAVTSVALGFDVSYDGLRVKFGWSDALANVEYFFKIPRTIMEAEGQGWRRHNRPDDYLPELRLYCMSNRAVCALYDLGGFVAGLQIGLPVEEFQTSAFKPEQQFTRWRAQADFGQPAKDYWTISQYFVSEETLKEGGPQVEQGWTLQDGGVWVRGAGRAGKGGKGELIKVPVFESDLVKETHFKKQNCVPNMGTHYYYNMTPQMRCENMLPWFVLVTEEELIGTGFQVFGRLISQPKERAWFEHTPSPQQGAQVAIPSGPACLYEWAAAQGVVSLHIYYIDRPWTIRCKPGDSLKPAPVYSRLMMSGYRYASQLADQLKKLFTG